MKKTTLFLIMLSAMQAHAMESLIDPHPSNPSTESLCQRLCRLLGVSNFFKAQNPNNDRSLSTDRNINREKSMIEMLNNLSLHTFTTVITKQPIVKFLDHPLWPQILRFLTPQDLLALSQTNRKIFNSIRSAPVFNHQLYLHHQSNIFYDEVRKFDRIALSEKQTEQFLNSRFKNSEYSIATGCANLVPIVIHAELQSELETFAHIKSFISSFNVLLVGDEGLMKEPDLYPYTIAAHIINTDIIPTLPFDKVKHISFCISLKIKDSQKESLQSLMLVPRLTHLSITHVNKKDHLHSFFIKNLAEVQSSFQHLQEFVYKRWESKYYSPINIPKDTLKNMLSLLSDHAPCLVQLSFPSHTLEEAESISEEIQKFKKLKTLCFAKAQNKAFSILDFLGSEIEEITMPLHKSKDESLAERDFVYEKTTKFINAQTHIRICNLNVFPNDKERHFIDLLTGYSRQKNLTHFSCTISCVESISHAINILRACKKLDSFSVHLSLNSQHYPYLENNTKNLVNEICKNNSLVKNSEGTIELISNNVQFLMFASSYTPLFPIFHELQDYAPKEKAEIRKILHTKTRSSSHKNINLYLEKEKKEFDENYQTFGKDR